jgi:GNAT superfamily N-acetyltransferase
MTTTALSFREATPSDAEAISHLVNSAYRGEYSKQGWTTEADLLGGQRTSPSLITELIQAPHSSIRLAFYPSHPLTLIGCVHTRLDPDETLYFGMLVVDPKIQAQGLGRQILQDIDQFARSRGCRQIRISVIDRRLELIEFYKRRGFQLTELYTMFPENDPAFGIPKVKGLKLMEMIKTFEKRK